jgi:hypothetical protein
MRRREFIAAFGGAVPMGPLAVRAQQPVMPVIGVLDNNPPDQHAGGTGQ